MARPPLQKPCAECSSTSPCCLRPAVGSSHKARRPRRRSPARRMSRRARAESTAHAIGGGWWLQLATPAGALPAPPVPPTPCVTAAFLSTAQATGQAATILVNLRVAATGRCLMALPATIAVEAIIHVPNGAQQDMRIVPRTATKAVSALLNRTAPQARHSWPACLCGAAKQPTPAHGAAAPATPTNSAHARAQVRA